jgi:hypothetical protein
VSEQAVLGAASDVMTLLAALAMVTALAASLEDRKRSQTQIA